jgi:hypothetical protein
VRHWHAELGRGDLGECRLVALAMRGLGRDHGQMAVRLQASDGPLAADRETDCRKEVRRAGRRLDVGREADAEQPALLPGATLLYPEPVIVDELDGALERVDRRDSLDRRAGHHLAGLLLERQQVPAAHVDRIEL